MATFEFSNNYDGSWFFSSYWSGQGWTCYAKNLTSDSQCLSGITFRLTPGNSGGISFNVGGSSYAQANGAGCQMYAICEYGSKSTQSPTVKIAPQTTRNILSSDGTYDDNTKIWFDRDDEKEYDFYFNDPLIIPPGKSGTIQFRVKSWSQGYAAGYPCLQIRSRYATSEPTKYVVTFNLNGGQKTDNIPLVQNVSRGSSATCPGCKKAGYQLTGWDKSWKKIQKNTTITALWKALPVWRYNGTKWVQELPVKVYNGSKWVDGQMWQSNNNKWSKS